MKVAGVDNKPTTLLLSDTQLFNESLLEDICNILNNGEVPNLFPPEEKAKILEEITDPEAQTNNQKYQVIEWEREIFKYCLDFVFLVHEIHCLFFVSFRSS